MEQSIKSFIYLDDYKLYSLSSQMFQGFTEYIISGSTASTEEEEKQKGAFASGKMMSDILKKEKSSTEKKYLHDYAFNLLESELSNRGILHTITSTDTTDTIQSKGIVKVQDVLYLMIIAHYSQQCLDLIASENLLVIFK